MTATEVQLRAIVHARLTTGYARLAGHSTQLTTRYALLTTGYARLAGHSTQLTARYALLTTGYACLTTGYSSE